MFFRKDLPFHTSSFLGVCWPSNDPVNNLLSFGYTLLHTNIFSMVLLIGLNPYLGFFHVERKRNLSLINDLFRGISYSS